MIEKRTIRFSKKLRPTIQTVRIPGKPGPLFPWWTMLLATLIFGFVMLSFVALFVAPNVWTWRSVAATLLSTWCGVYVLGESIRWRFRISTRVLLALVSFVCVLCAIFADHLATTYVQQRCVDRILESGGRVAYTFETSYTSWGKGFRTKSGWIFPFFVRDVFGKDLFACPTVVDANRSKLDDSTFQDLAILDDLVELQLEHTRITDAGLESIAQCTRLTELSLRGTRITDRGLNHLAHLKNLRYLNIELTDVSGPGVASIRKALPRCAVLMTLIQVPWHPTSDDIEQMDDAQLDALVSYIVRYYPHLVPSDGTQSGRRTAKDFIASVDSQPVLSEPRRTSSYLGRIMAEKGLQKKALIQFFQSNSIELYRCAACKAHLHSPTARSCLHCGATPRPMPKPNSTTP